MEVLWPPPAGVPRGRRSICTIAFERAVNRLKGSGTPMSSSPVGVDSEGQANGLQRGGDPT